MQIYYKKKQNRLLVTTYNYGIAQADDYIFHVIIVMEKKELTLL